MGVVTWMISCAAVEKVTRELIAMTPRKY